LVNEKEKRKAGRKMTRGPRTRRRNVKSVNSPDPYLSGCEERRSIRKGDPKRGAGGGCKTHMRRGYKPLKRGPPVGFSMRGTLGLNFIGEQWGTEKNLLHIKTFTRTTDEDGRRSG